MENSTFTSKNLDNMIYRNKEKIAVTNLGLEAPRMALLSQTNFKPTRNR